MDALNNYSDLTKEKQNQILKLVTKSFYRELTSYGVETADIVKVSVNLLDYVTSNKEDEENANGYYNKLFSISAVHNLWGTKKTLSIHNVSIQPLLPAHIPQISAWLKEGEISQTFIRFFPQDKIPLESYLLKAPARKYFAVYAEDDVFVGIVGAENIDETFRKLEMKKFIGARNYQGKGLGKAATFLFLYYAFNILNFNKVYIHSLDTNIKNINLNSRFGFELEGILYEEAHVGGMYKDVLRMGLLYNHWEPIFGKNESE